MKPCTDCNDSTRHQCCSCQGQGQIPDPEDLYEQSPSSYYPPGYEGPAHPHNNVRKIKIGWRCIDCGAIARGVNDLIGKDGCKATVTPCPHCGYAPVCSFDCSGVLTALCSTPDVYVSGGGLPGGNA